MTKLSVNLNKVALLRNARTLDVPSVSQAARICVEAGADGITVHPRPDQRHIRPGDVYTLAEMLSVELNVEGNPFSEHMNIVREVRPILECSIGHALIADALIMGLPTAVARYREALRSAVPSA